QPWDPATELPEQQKHGWWGIRQARCFLVPEWVTSESQSETRWSKTSVVLKRGNPAVAWERIIPEVIHVPGMRGNLERTSPRTAVGPMFPGTFDKYAASVIAHWCTEDSDWLKKLGNDLSSLGLTWRAVARAVSDTQVEVQVGRLPWAVVGHDLVNIADVGFGLSQVLPVVTALLAANPGQLVYIEQPETHLHPQAQFALAQVFANAAKRGVRVVAETHSTMLLLGVQALVAEGRLEADIVKLHWFQ